MTGRRYIRASELRSFSFCRRAWFFEREGQASTLHAERRRGSADHRQHGGAVVQATTAARLSSALFTLALFALAAAAALWWHSR